MANNVFGGGNNPRVLIADTNISAMGFTVDNTRKVVLPGVNGEPDKSNVPGSNFNTLTGVLPKWTGIDIFTKPGQDRDMTAFVYGGGFGPDNTVTAPAPPTVTGDDVANTLTATHALGASEIEVSENNGAYTAYAGQISVGNVARASGYWKFRTKAATGRPVSTIASSPAFTVAAVVVTPVFADSFDGTGAYNGSTHPANGTATVGGNPTLDGTGKLVFAGVGDLSITSTLPAARKQTAIIAAFPAETFINVYAKYGTEGVVVGLIRNANGTYDFNISTGATPNQVSNAISGVTFPITIDVTINGNNIAATLNGANQLTHTTDVVGEAGSITFSGGGSLDDYKILPL